MKHVELIQKYKDLLDVKFQENLNSDDKITPENELDYKLEFIGDVLFGFCTYEDEIMKLMTVWALEVSDAINNHTNFELISTPEGNFWYLVMINMPFFDKRLEWGTSIRGAWWDHIDVFEVPMIAEKPFTRLEFRALLKAARLFCGFPYTLNRDYDPQEPEEIFIN